MVIRMQPLCTFTTTITCKCARCLRKQLHQHNQQMKPGDCLQTQTCNKFAYAAAYVELTRTVRTIRARTSHKTYANHTRATRCKRQTAEQRASKIQNVRLAKSIGRTYIPADTSSEDARCKAKHIILSTQTRTQNTHTHTHTRARIHYAAESLCLHVNVRTHTHTWDTPTATTAYKCIRRLSKQQRANKRSLQNGDRMPTHPRYLFAYEVAYATLTHYLRTHTQRHDDAACPPLVFDQYRGKPVVRCTTCNVNA